MFYDKWTNGDDQLDVELKYLLTEKSESFNVRFDVTCLKELADKHAFTAPIIAGSAKLLSDKQQIDADELALILKTASHDLNVLNAWKKMQVHRDKCVLCQAGMGCDSEQSSSRGVRHVDAKTCHVCVVRGR
jgi:hypothetical protein